MPEAAAPAPLSPDELEARRTFANSIPIFQTLGMEVVWLKPRKARLKLPFREALTQPAGLMHGGAIAALADSAVAQALVASVGPDTQFTTLELKINYLRPVTGGTLWAECELVHHGRRTALGEVTLTDDQGTLVSKCLATYMLLRSHD